MRLGKQYRKKVIACLYLFHNYLPSFTVCCFCCCFVIINSNNFNFSFPLRSLSLTYSLPSGDIFSFPPHSLTLILLLLPYTSTSYTPRLTHKNENDCRFPPTSSSSYLILPYRQLENHPIQCVSSSSAGSHMRGSELRENLRKF